MLRGRAPTAPWQDRVGATLDCWLEGRHLVELWPTSCWDRHPARRLAETIPVRLEDNSSFLNPGDSGRLRYGQGLFVGYRGYDRLEAGEFVGHLVVGGTLFGARIAGAHHSAEVSGSRRAVAGGE